MGISKLGIKGDWENSCQLWNRETKAKEVNNQGFFQKREYQKKRFGKNARSLDCYNKSNQ